MDVDVDGFERDGHTVVRGLGSHLDLAAMRAALEPFQQRARERLAPMAERSTYDRAFLQMMNLWRTDPTVRAFTFDPVFAGVAAQLMQVPAVRLYHDQALVKEPGGGGTPWHQDQRYWPLDGSRAVTMWMALDECTVEMGTMRFASGTHRLGDLGPLPISDESERQLAALIEREQLSVAEPVVMHAGDASFHDGWVIHGTGPNTTQRHRIAMTVIYLQDGAVVTEADSPERRNDLATWLPGLAPGDLVDTPLNPRLG
jgi:ectoine hydroxylase-related dioxygenase (phytanoyl-CoA dioxygenase family)